METTKKEVYKPKELRVLEEGPFRLITYLNKKKELQARINKAPTGQLVFAKKVKSVEEAEDALYKMAARQEQRVFLRKYTHNNKYCGHMSVFRETEPDTYTVFFFRVSGKGLSRRFREKIQVAFSSKEEMFEFFLKVFTELKLTYGIGSDKFALEEEKYSSQKVVRPTFSIKETFLTKVGEI